MRQLWRTSPFPSVWLIGFFQEASFFLLVNLPGRFQELGIGEAGIGVAYSLSAVASLVLRPWFGKVLDVLHRRTVLRIAGIGNVAAIALLAVLDAPGATLWAVFLAQRTLQALLFTTLLTYAADSLPPSIRTHGLAIFGLSGLIPIATSNLVGDALIVRAGYPAVLTAAAVSGTISWLLVFRLPALPVLGERPRRSFWAVVSQPDMLPLWWMTLVFAMGMETIFTFMRTYVESGAPASLGIIFGVYGTCAVATRLFGGSRYDRFPQRSLTALAVAVQALAFLLIAASSGRIMLLGGAAMLGTAHGAVFPVLSSQVVDRARTAERGSAMATFTSLFDVGLLVVGPSIGFVISLSGYSTAFFVIGAVLAAGVAVYLALEARLTRAVLG